MKTYEIKYDEKEIHLPAYDKYILYLDCMGTYVNDNMTRKSQTTLFIGIFKEEAMLNYIDAIVGT